MRPEPVEGHTRTSTSAVLSLSKGAVLSLSKGAVLSLSKGAVLSLSKGAVLSLSKGSAGIQPHSCLFLGGVRLFVFSDGLDRFVYRLGQVSTVQHRAARAQRG
jgi:hypothetical protein